MAWTVVVDAVGQARDGAVARIAAEPTISSAARDDPACLEGLAFITGAATAGVLVGETFDASGDRLDAINLASRVGLSLEDPVPRGNAQIVARPPARFCDKARRGALVDEPFFVLQRYEEMGFWVVGDDFIDGRVI